MGLLLNLIGPGGEALLEELGEGGGLGLVGTVAEAGGVGVGPGVGG